MLISGVLPPNIGEESAANGMIQIGPEEGKKSRFCV